MRRSTAILLAGLVLALAALTWSARQAGVRDAVAGEPVRLTFAAWGGAQEIIELRERVIDPINALQDRYVIAW